MITIHFEFETRYGPYHDIIQLPEDHGLSDSEIEAIKQQMLSDWIAVSMIWLPFTSEIATEYGLYGLTLWLPEDHGLADSEIEAMKQQKFDEWIANKKTELGIVNG